VNKFYNSICRDTLLNFNQIWSGLYLLPNLALGKWDAILINGLNLLARITADKVVVISKALNKCIPSFQTFARNHKKCVKEVPFKNAESYMPIITSSRGLGSRSWRTKPINVELRGQWL